VLTHRGCRLGAASAAGGSCPTSCLGPISCCYVSAYPCWRPVGYVLLLLFSMPSAFGFSSPARVTQTVCFPLRNAFPSGFLVVFEKPNRSSFTFTFIPPSNGFHAPPPIPHVTGPYRLGQAWSGVHPCPAPHPLRRCCIPGGLPAPSPNPVVQGRYCQRPAGVGHVWVGAHGVHLPSHGHSARRRPGKWYGITVAALWELLSRMRSRDTPGMLPRSPVHMMLCFAP
jgi:hypothetical protein